MKTIKTMMTTTAVFSDDRLKRYSLCKVWDDSKPKLAIIMLAPSEASGVEMDTTTQLVLNNAVRLGYGSVTTLNLFSTLGDYDLKQAEAEDGDNLKVIVESAKGADEVVYAAGVGKAKNKAFIARQQQVLNALQPFESKLRCLTNQGGQARFQHPLSPAVRVWYLSPFKISELLGELTIKERTKEAKKKKSAT